jgi:hypothetical protein
LPEQESLIRDLEPGCTTPRVCGKFLSSENGSLSIVYREGALHDQHGLLGEADVQATVVDFLRHNIRK